MASVQTRAAMAVRAARLVVAAAVLAGLLATTAGAGTSQFRNGQPGRREELAVPEPTPFATAEGKGGWRVKLPGGKILAAPAVADGILYVVDSVPRS